jgi:hypothetical protein
MGDRDQGFDEELRRWQAESRRFRAFVATNADKVRKKRRQAKDDESLRDLRGELGVARGLLADRRFEVIYEAYGAGRLGPDFSVTFRSSDRFDIEVTRLRGVLSAEAFGRVILAKLRQLAAGVPSVLVVAVDGELADVSSVEAAARTLRQRADRRDEAVLGAAGFRDGRAFYDRYLRLSAVIVWAASASGDSRAAAWTNASARHPLPPRVVRAALTALRVG